MKPTTGEPEGYPRNDEAIPDVTRIPLLRLAPRGDTVLDAALRRLIEDVVTEGEITAGFGNIP